MRPRTRNKNWEQGEEFLKFLSFHWKSMCGRGRGAWARAGWRVWMLGYGRIILWKAICENTLQPKTLKLTIATVAKVLKNKFGLVIEKSSDLVLGLFGFVKATKFIDLSEFSECLRSALAKSCLPCQFICTPKNKCELYYALQCYRGLVLK